MKTIHLIFATSLLLVSAAAVAAPRPNIILAMADDMGWGDPSSYSNQVTYANGRPHPNQGWISTPTIDAMAANGLRFNRFYAASAVCSPTRASCLTGRNPFRVGVPFANQGRLGFDETPLSEVLSAAGYHCGHFGKWHLGSMTTLRPDSNRGGNADVYSAPWHHGYDVCFATESKVPTYHPYRKTTNGLALPSSFSDPNFYGARYWRMPTDWNTTSGEGSAVPVGEVNNLSNGDDSKLIVDQAIPFIQDAVARDQPFFLVLWFHTPHKPLVDPDGVSGTDSSDALRDSIEDMDTALGRLRTELGTLGVRDDTMLWLTSDNGPENGDDSPDETSTTRSLRSGRFLMRKRSLHEGGLRVPGILEWPAAIQTGRTTDFPAVTSDYYPTILDYLQLSVPNQKPIDGISLRPLVDNSSSKRTNPIGFKINSERSWVNERYKLIGDGSGWELFDLIEIPAGEEVEQTPIATTANIGGKPQAIQDIYESMLQEFTAWDASLSDDSAYIHATRPTVTLTTTAKPGDMTFTVTATFSEAVNQLHAHEFAVTNAEASDLSGEGSEWSVTITPSASGRVTVELPEAAAIDPDGNPNGPSNLLTIDPISPPAQDAGISHEYQLEVSEYQTVDSGGLAPASGSNNVLKFTAGTANSGVDCPFTTSLYLRSSSGGSEEEARRVRAFTRFDLSALPDDPVREAFLEFSGHSLNDIGSNSTSLQVMALAAPWSVSATPPPTFNHLTTGDALDGGSVVLGLDPADHTRDYRVDVTSIVSSWKDATIPNHGLQLRLADTAINNGVGVALNGPGAIRLTIKQAPLVITSLRPGPIKDALTLEWNSVPQMLYRIESSPDLISPWSPLAEVEGSAEETSTFALINALLEPSRKFFYRVAPVTP